MFGHPARHFGAQERFGRVVHAVWGAEGGGVLGAAGPEVRFVDDEQRRAVCLGEVADLDAAESHRTVIAAVHPAGPDRWV